MKNFQIVLIIFLIIILCYSIAYFSNEKFENQNQNQTENQTQKLNFGPFKSIPETRMTDPYVCFPGTYWRNKSYKDICLPMKNKRPQRMSVEGENTRPSEPRYELVCSPDERGNRNCQMVKIYNTYN